jgi:hypothetical protein
MSSFAEDSTFRNSSLDSLPDNMLDCQFICRDDEKQPGVSTSEAGLYAPTMFRQVMWHRLSCFQTLQTSAYYLAKPPRIGLYICSWMLYSWEELFYHTEAGGISCEGS